MIGSTIPASQVGTVGRGPRSATATAFRSIFFSNCDVPSEVLTFNKSTLRLVLGPHETRISTLSGSRCSSGHSSSKSLHFQTHALIPQRLIMYGGLLM